uniref:Uncharacterized protein n=1 Tax=Kalanchoe fedtschenkoi TaxID=63787 RepID=A0A7N0UZM1_KALFE
MTLQQHKIVQPWCLLRSLSGGRERMSGVNNVGGQIRSGCISAWIFLKGLIYCGFLGLHLRIWCALILDGTGASCKIQ